MMPDTFDEEEFNAFYNRNDPNINEEAKKILMQYSGVSEDLLIVHIRAVRDKAWSIFKYPCVGMYSFLDLSISTHETYPYIVKQLIQNSDAKLLDLGCCFGQDVRKLVFDGVSPEKIYGTELDRQYIDLGYELFRDKAKLDVIFSTGDFLGADAFVALELKEASFDFVHAASFFHLFSWDDQVKAISRAITLLKPSQGSKIFGRQSVAEEPKIVESSLFYSGEIYRHNQKSFRRLVEQVERETSTKLTVKLKMYDQSLEHEEKRAYLQFCITLV